MTSAAHVDLYQLTSLVTHDVAGHTDDRVVMTFFSRALPKNPSTGVVARSFLLWVGLQRGLDHLERARFSGEAIDLLLKHDMLGPALAKRPALVERLRAWRDRRRDDVLADREIT